jgi:hypothetical protein
MRSAQSRRRMQAHKMCREGRQECIFFIWTRPAAPEAKKFFASCYDEIVKRTYVTHPIESNGSEEQGAQAL